MRAAVVTSAGAVPVYGDFDEPVVGDHQTVVSLVAAGIHPVVRSLASGRHYGSGDHWPIIPGVDAVARTSDGQQVYTGFVTEPYGTFAERMAVPSAVGFPLPDGADPVAVAAGVNPGLSSWLPLRARAADVAALGTVLVLGVTGMAGALAVQNAYALGADRVVGAGRSPAGLARARELGAEVLALSGDVVDDAAALVELLAGRSPGLVLDFVWGPVAETAFRALGGRGLAEDAGDIAYVEIGAMSGAEAALPASLLRSRRIRISGSGAGSTPMAVLQQEIPAYLQLIADQRVQVPALNYPLSDVGSAWAAAATGGPRPVVVPS